MTVNETLQTVQDTSEFKKTFKNATGYTNGVEAAKTGYSDKSLVNSECAHMLGVALVQPSVKTVNQGR